MRKFPASLRKKKFIFGWALVFLVGALIILLVPIAQPQVEAQDRTFEIEASRFSYNMSQISVNPGDRVTLKLNSTDVVHGLSLDNYNLEMQVDPGQPDSRSFIADKPGVFRFRCTIPCGNLHPFMIGKLTVGTNVLFYRGIALVIFFAIASLISVWSHTFTGKEAHG